MNVVVGVMDADAWRARTDNLVHIAPASRTLTWIPRDLWCESLRDRINTAYARGGVDALARACAEHGLPVDHVVCLRRGATEAFLATISVTVPVDQRQEFWYPLSPGRRIEDGRRRIVFEPPMERLAGVRLHEWVGARSAINGPGTDLSRMLRQQTLVRRLLEERVDFSGLLADQERIRVSDMRALEILRMVDADWLMTTFDNVVPQVLDAKHVLVAACGERGDTKEARAEADRLARHRHWRSRLRRLGKRLRRRLLGVKTLLR